MNSTVEQFISEVNSLVKEAFIPSPMFQQGQPQGDPSQGSLQAQAGAGQQGGGDIQSLLQQLPPETAQQISQLPPDQQAQLLQQVMGGGGGAQSPGVPGALNQAPPTDLSNTTVTISLADLLDLVSGGEASKSKLTVKDHEHKIKLKQQELERKYSEKQQQAAAQAQAQESSMLGSGGIYGMPMAQ